MHENKTGEIKLSEGRGNARYGLGRGKILLLFAIGFLLGVSLKAQSVKTITIGFNDYKLKNLKSDFQLLDNANIKNDESEEDNLGAKQEQEPGGGQGGSEESLPAPKQRE